MISKDNIFPLCGSCYLHYVTPVNCCRCYEQTLHRVEYVIEIQEELRPISSCIDTIPLSVHVYIPEFLDMLTIVESAFEIVDSNDPQDEQEEYHDYNHIEDRRDRYDQSLY